MPPSRARNSAEGTRRRARAERAGRLAEALAASYLRLKLYRVRARRVKTPVGEIDLVAERFGVLVFVEVKARRRADHEASALHAVNARRITRAARHHIARHPELAKRTMRFDVIFLAPFRLPRHVRGAFETTE